MKPASPPAQGHLARRVASFRYALQGGATLLRTQPNARIHLAATIIVVALAAVIRVSRTDWALLALAIGLVWLAESLNTALEFLADEVSLERRPRLGRAKDVAAFGVLAAALAAAGIGLAVFYPHLRAWL